MTAPILNTAEIAALLRAARSAFVGRALLEGLVCGFAVGAVLVFVGVGLLGPLALGEPWRPWLVRGIGLSLVVTTALGPVAAWRRWASDGAVAARLERTFPALRTDVRAVLELWGAGAAPNPDAAALRAHLAARVASELRAAVANVNAAVPRRDLRPWTAALCVALVASVATINGGPAAWSQGWRYLVAGYPAPVSTLVPEQLPLVSALDVLYGFAPYTGLPPQRVTGTRGDIETLPGTTVEVRGTSLLTLVEARIVVTAPGGETIVPLELTDGREFVGRFTVMGEGSYRFELGPADGGPRRTDPLERRIRTVPDQAPVIELILPEAVVEVTADQVVDFEFIASDDFGLGPVQLAWQFNGDDDSRRVTPLRDATGERTSQEHVPLELAELALQPRDEIVVVIEALDNNAISGPQTGRSRPVLLRVAAPEDQHAATLELKRQLFESLLARLGTSLPASLNEWRPSSAEGSGEGSVEGSAEGLEAVPSVLDPAGLAARVQAASTARQGWDETVGLITQLGQAMQSDTLSTPADIELFDQIVTRLLTAERDHARALEDAMVLVRTGADVTPRYAAAAEADAALIARTERSVLLLQDLVAAHQADDAARTLQELADIRERLRDLLEQYRQTNDPALREQIERELRRLEARMRELLEQLATQVETLPYEHLNAEGLEPSELSEQVTQMGSALDQLREALDQNDVESAIAALDALGQDMQALAGEMGAALEGARPDKLSEFDQAMGELMDEINAIEARQQALEEQTGALNEAMNAQRQAELRQEIDRRLAEARERVDAVQQAFREAPDDLVSESTRELLLETDRGLQQLESALERSDVATAAEQAAQLQSRLSDLEWQVERDLGYSQRQTSRRQQLEANREAARMGEQAMRDVTSSMQELLEMSQPQPNAQQRGQLEQLGQQQQGLQQQLGELGQRMAELGERMPVPSPDGEPMQRAQQGMEGATGELRGGRPRPAQQGQMQAIEGLRGMRQQLQQMMQRQRQQRGSEGRQQSRHDVEIPQESEAARQQWRQQVLDGMREGGLDTYEEQLRWYYESLVR